MESPLAPPTAASVIEEHVIDTGHITGQCGSTTSHGINTCQTTDSSTASYSGIEMARVHGKIEPESGRALELTFNLEPSRYATVLLRELMRLSEF